jgi:hypothetical protein
MNKIISTDDFTIFQDERNSLYTIEFPSYTNSQLLINSITKTKIIIGATVTNDYTSVSFKASSVRQYKRDTYTCTYTYTKGLQMVKNLASQLEYLIVKTHNTFIGYNPSNIIVIDENKFIYLSNEHLHSIDKKNNITITSPFTKDDFFLSPELENTKIIPSSIHYKTSYYSLACLIIYVFTSEEMKIYQNNDNENDNNISGMLDFLSIKETKLYWLLERCLVQEPKKRCILFI